MVLCECVCVRDHVFNYPLVKVGNHRRAQIFPLFIIQQLFSQSPL